jgi:hypothetical protein
VQFFVQSFDERETRIEFSPNGQREPWLLPFAKGQPAARVGILPLLNAHAF